MQGEGVAERRHSTRQNLRHGYCFDRLLVEKLVQAYDLLVPDKQWAVGQSTEPKEALNAQASGDLCACFLGSPERESHHCQPDGGADSTCRDARVRSSLEWVFQDEGYSGANLVRPGLEALRDLAAQGHIEAVLAH